MKSNHLRHTRFGLYFEPADFYLDPKKGVQRAVISHAHSDHAVCTNQEVWCTPPTRSIMSVRYGDTMRTRFHLKEYNEVFRIGDAEIRLVPAGHILGSAQVVIDYEGTRYVYTGDFKLRPDRSCAPFETVPCDVLITETTFADPMYAHAPEEEEFSKLERYQDQSLVIGAYVLGKAQRLTLLLNELLPSRKVMVHPDAVPFHHLYEQEGFPLGEWRPYNYREFRRNNDYVLVVPPRALSTWLNDPRVATTFATGWKRSFFRTNFAFCLSDHADWQELLTLVSATSPKHIIPVHGDGSKLMEHLKAKPKQLELF